MSLYAKLISAVVSLLILLILTTLYFTGVGSSQYLGEQLTIENLNDANETAQAISLQQLDPALIELRLAAKYDLGSYRKIEWADPDGSVLFIREVSSSRDLDHALLRNLFPISSQPGSAELSNGWNILGTVTIQRHEDLHYDELWAITKQMLIALLVAALAATVVGNHLLRQILSPLAVVVDQARAIGERRFTLTSIKPSTLEFSVLTESMNELASRVREMLEGEAKKLTEQREKIDIDGVTRLFSREAFMTRLSALLSSESADSSGAIALTRIQDLQGLNRQLGREQVDNLLSDIGARIAELRSTNEHWVAGRLNGSDFCLIAPRESEQKVVAEGLQKALHSALKSHDLEEFSGIPTACRPYETGDTLGEVMTALDVLLSSAEKSAGSPIIASGESSDASATSMRNQEAYWLDLLDRALDNNLFSIELFPVLDATGMVVHREGMLRLRNGDAIHTAGEFMPWVNRFGRSFDVDQHVTQIALEQAAGSKEPICVNLSEAALADERYTSWLASNLNNRPDIRGKLLLDINETAAFVYAENFKALSASTRKAGIALGIEHMGYRISDIGALSELGMDYLKIDGLFTQDLSTNDGNIALVRTYLSIGKSLAVPCIAEGVRDLAELPQIFALGFQAASGPGVKE